MASSILSVFAYKDERVWRLIWSLKYKKSRKAARIGGHVLHRVLSGYGKAAGPILVVPMPITRKRRRERGFNQCELLSDEIENLDTDKRLIIARDLLLRVRHKSRQTLKDRRERLESARDIFAVNETAAKDLLEKLGGNPPATSPSANHLLIVIDDVVTTGSTIRDAVMTLRAAGFENVYGLSVAH